MFKILTPAIIANMALDWVLVVVVLPVVVLDDPDAVLAANKKPN
jgi:hypothetical protein